MSGLQLSRAGVIDAEAVRDRAQSAYDLLEEVEAQMLEELGVIDMPAPSTTPEPLMNVDVAALGNRELGGLHTRYVAYSVFLGTRLAKVISLERSARGSLKEVIAKIKNELRAAGVKEPKIPAQVEVHPLYSEQYVEHLKLFMMKEIMEAHHKAYRDMAAALSRNVTLRELEFEQEKRENSIQKSKGSSPVKRRNFAGRSK